MDHKIIFAFSTIFFFFFHLYILTFHRDDTWKLETAFLLPHMLVLVFYLHIISKATVQFPFPFFFFCFFLLLFDSIFYALFVVWPWFLPHLSLSDIQSYNCQTFPEERIFDYLSLSLLFLLLLFYLFILIFFSLGCFRASQNLDRLSLILDKVTFCPFIQWQQY